jgi:hypothetical protein
MSATHATKLTQANCSPFFNPDSTCGNKIKIEDVKRTAMSWEESHSVDLLHDSIGSVRFVDREYDVVILGCGERVANT